MMARSDDLLAAVGSTIQVLKHSGLATEANQLCRLVHEGAWNSSNEMIGDIGLAILKIQDSAADTLTDEAGGTGI